MRPELLPFFEKRTALDDTEAEALLAALRSDPTLLEELRAHLAMEDVISRHFLPERAEFDNRVASVSRAHGSSGRFIASVHQRARVAPLPTPRVSPFRLLAPFAAAAALVLAVGVILNVPGQGDDPDDIATFPIDDSFLRVGDRVTDASVLRMTDEVLAAGDRPATRQLDDGSLIELAPRGRATIRPRGQDGGQGMRMDLERGRVRASVEHQAPGQRLVFSTPDVEVEVLGTELMITRDDTGTHVSVRRGSVAVTRHSDNARAVVGEGCSIDVRASSQAPLVVAPSATLDDFDGGVGRWQTGTLGTGWIERRCVPGRDGGSAMELSCNNATGDYSWVFRPFRHGKRDWRRSAGLAFWLDGQGDGRRIQVNIWDNPGSGPKPQPSERFRHVFTDTIAGWRRVELPWSSFVRVPQHLQLDGAPDDGLTLNPMCGMDLVLHSGTKTIVVDDLELLPADPPAAGP
jgi:hypothetical protein